MPCFHLDQLWALNPAPRKNGPSFCPVALMRTSVVRISVREGFMDILICELFQFCNRFSCEILQIPS